MGTDWGIKSISFGDAFEEGMAFSPAPRFSGSCHGWTVRPWPKRLGEGPLCRGEKHEFDLGMVREGSL